MHSKRAKANEPLAYSVGDCFSVKIFIVWQFDAAFIESFFAVAKNSLKCWHEREFGRLGVSTWLHSPNIFIPLRCPEEWRQKNWFNFCALEIFITFGTNPLSRAVAGERRRTLLITFVRLLLIQCDKAFTIYDVRTQAHVRTRLRRMHGTTVEGEDRTKIEEILFVIQQQYAWADSYCYRDILKHYTPTCSDRSEGIIFSV